MVVNGEAHNVNGSRRRRTNPSSAVAGSRSAIASMDRARDRRSAAAASFLLFVLSLAVDASGPAPGAPLHALAGSPHLVLPLVLSRANLTRRSPGSRRFLSRQLSANARMRLYDDLLTNGCASLPIVLSSSAALYI